MYTTSYKNIHKNLFRNTQPSIFPRIEIAIENTEFEKAFGTPGLVQEIKKMLSTGESKGFDIISQAYAGFQFGNFAILGDGRAHLLGEHTYQGKKYDIQLKGSGPSPYSRGGDGKATIRAMLREYLISEAMHGLNIPTSRSLAVFRTHEAVLRNTDEPGAVLIRIAQSHIRVGTFSLARAYEDVEVLEKLTDYTIERHYLHIKKSKNQYSDFIREVGYRQISLIVNWLRVGFIHGVMNTDNTFISGETLDYGPCAFLNGYNPQKVFSSIDKNGRYSYINQMPIIIWNLTRFIESLLPLLSSKEDEALEIAKSHILDFQAKLSEEYRQMMHRKIGITQEDTATDELLQELLSLMENNNLDYTNTFLSLEKTLLNQNYTDSIIEILALWIEKWKKYTTPNSPKIMQETNPGYIPRNHLVEKVLYEGEKGDMSGYYKLLEILLTPYSRKENMAFQSADPNDHIHRTFCGT